MRLTCLKGTAHSPPPTVKDAILLYRIFVHFHGLLTAGFLLLSKTRAELLNKTKNHFHFISRFRLLRWSSEAVSTMAKVFYIQGSLTLPSHLQNSKLKLVVYLTSPLSLYYLSLANFRQRKTSLTCTLTTSGYRCWHYHEAKHLKSTAVFYFKRLWL